MKNTIKMSLVAALAVSALSTSASAGNLEDMIKGVSVSGKMEVEYDRTTRDTSPETSTNSWDLDWDFTAKVPVNDSMTAVFGMEGDTGTDVQTQNINSDKGADNVQVTKVYFQYANGPVTTLVGKQGMAGAPWFDDERANGVVGLYNAGFATLAAAHFTGQNGHADTGKTIALGNADISAVAAIGKIGPVNASVWYANLAGITSTIDADSVSVNLNGDIAMVNLDVTHTDTDYDVTGGTNGEASLTKVVASVGLDMATVYAGYGTTDKNQHAAGVDLTSDDDASVNFKSEQLSIDALADADAYLIGAKIPAGAATFDISYLDGEYGTTSIDFNEILIQADYKMSKNFTIGSHYSIAEMGTGAGSETEDIAVSLEYKF